MQRIEPVTRLADVDRVVQVEPLSPECQDFYTDLSQGRSTRDLGRMKIRLEEAARPGSKPAKIAFTGHRGCGKSTELLRLEEEFKQRFTAIHFEVTKSEVITDYDYADLFLDLSLKILQYFQQEKLPLDPRIAADISSWFADVSLEEVKTVKKEIGFEAEAEAKAKHGLLGLSVSLLAKVRSKVTGSQDNRQTVRQKLQRDPDELLGRFNLLITHAIKALRDAQRPDQLLLVVDNLDRLAPAVAKNLFFNGGDFLKMPVAHMIFTVPIASSMSPRYIGTVFEDAYSLPMVKVRTPKGAANKPAVDAFLGVVNHRMNVDAVFEAPGLVKTLAMASGGSVRDLMRLLNYAQQDARARGVSQIDKEGAKEAILKMRLDYQRLLIPAASFYPYLARIHRTKHDGIASEGELDPKKDAEAREFFSQLLNNGSVLEYNGNDCWYDVHPVIHDIPLFKQALAALSSEAP